MSARRARAATAALLAAVLLALLVAAGASLASAGGARVAPRYVATAVSKRAARRDVERRVAAVTWPSWARRVAPRSPLTSPRLRGHYPFYAFGAPHQLSAAVFLSFRGGQRAALRWFLDHPPAGSTLYNRVAGPTRDNEWYRCLGFELGDGLPVYGERSLTLCAVRSHGRTSVRVDAAAVWLEGRSRYERIPRGSRYMEVVVSAGGRNRRSALVLDPARIGSVVDLVNSLPVLQRDTCVPELEEPSRSNPRVEVLFRSSRAGWPISRIATELVQQEGCTALHFWLRGRSERPLAESRLVIEALQGRIERLRRALLRIR